MKKIEINIPLSEEEQEHFQRVKNVYCRKNKTGQLAVWDTRLIINQDNLSHFQDLMRTASEELPFPQAPKDSEIDYYHFVDQLWKFLYAVKNFADSN